MQLILFSVAAFCFSLFIGIYGLYFLLVLRNPKQKDYLALVKSAFMTELPLERLPKVSILVPAHNEEEVLSRKLQNISAINYPSEKIEVIVIDDCSTDKTAYVAQRALDELSLRGKVIRNSIGLGVNACYNRGVEESEGDLILTTDADVTIDDDALMRGVKIFESLKKVGGVTGKMVPVANNLTSAALVEKSYRSIYDSTSTVESAIHSTFPGYTCFALLKKSAFPQLPPHYGSSDGNISLAVIRKGLRFLSVPGILFYEPISTKVAEQRKQKIRRAARLIQSIMANKDMLFKGNYESFGRTVFPLRFAMMLISPFLFFTGLVATVLAISLISVLFGLLLLLFFLLGIYLGAKTDFFKLNLFSSFVLHQFYLLLGVFSSQRRAATWNPVERSVMTCEVSEGLPSKAQRGNVYETN